MAKHRIVIDVDGSEMFDAMAALSDHDCAKLGFSLVSVLMTGEPPGFQDAVRMKMHGIDFVSSEKL